MTSKLLGAWIFFAVLFGGQFFADGAMALARAGSVPHILPMSRIFVFVLAVVLLAFEFILTKMESKGGYAE